MKTPINVFVPSNRVIAMLEDLEFLVVSLDQLGSSCSSAEQSASALQRFVVDGDVYARLAAIRRTLFDVLDGQLSGDQLSQLESTLESVKPWSNTA